MTLSIVIPAYNERKRLPQTLTRIHACFAGGQAGELRLLEVLVVDDGSTDGTKEAVLAFADRLPVRVLSLPQNRGKGAAVRMGMLAAVGDLAVFYDADGATPPEEIVRLAGVMAATHADIVIGSRITEEQGIVTMTLPRRLIGRLYHALCSPLVPGLKDTACGCKLFTKAAAQALFRLQTIDRFAFDVEVLFLARRLGYTLQEVTVKWTAVGESKVRVVRDGFNMFRSVAGLYWIWLKGIPS